MFIQVQFHILPRISTSRSIPFVLQLAIQSFIHLYVLSTRKPLYTPRTLHYYLLLRVIKPLEPFQSQPHITLAALPTHVPQLLLVLLQMTITHHLKRSRYLTKSTTKIHFLPISLPHLPLPPNEPSCDAPPINFPIFSMPFFNSRIGIYVYFILSIIK